MDATSDGQILFHYASGGFMGASETTIGEMSATMAKVTGSLLGTGGAVLGTGDGAELAMGGTVAPFHIRATTWPQKELTLKDHNTRKLSLNDTHASLHGTWQADSPFNITADPAQSAQSFSNGIWQGPNATLNMFTSYGADTLETVTQHQVKLEHGADGFTVYHDGVRKLRASSTKTSQLHGQWVMTDIITVSDRRFKRNIRSLLAEGRGRSSVTESGQTKDAAGAQSPGKKNAELFKFLSERFAFNLIDRVQIPADIAPGEYVLSFRWDCEQTPQIWQNCADVTITPPSSIEAAKKSPGFLV